MSQDHLVSFPTSESAPVAPVPHLPFRRISLPSVPSLAAVANRQSVVSLTSSDSLAEQRRGKRRSLNPSARARTRTPADDARIARREKVISEFYDTEKSYVDGLDLVYRHFLTPILASLDTNNPLLTRHEITTLFSNFIDIWNFHHTFFVAFTAHVHPLPSSSSSIRSASLSSLFLAHFPYLSLYTPFITAFPASIALLSSLSQNHSPNVAFSNFIRVQESHPICAHLRLTDYLLTLVQRCPRYLLLLRDLLEATHPRDPEWVRLQEARDLVAKITTSLNASLTTHAQTLALLSIQRNTRDLPPHVTPLVAPRRELVKRGMLVREWGTCDGGGRTLCELVLLNDHLLCLERDELGFLPQSIETGPRLRRPKHAAGGSGDGGDDNDNKWVCRGIVNLVDMEVVMGVDRTGGGAASEERLEVLSPEGSFALYAASAVPNSEDPNSLTSWITALRAARATRLAEVALFNPDSTLSASASSVHVRRAIKAYAIEGDRDMILSKGLQTRKNAANHISRSVVRRAHIENFLPPVWVPDAKTDACMKCGRPFGFVLDLRLADVFGWASVKNGKSGGEARHKVENERGAWRRKHHCRLCGHVVCAACSSKTFYIVDADSGPSSRNKSRAETARACHKCYEAAFPIIDPLYNMSSIYPMPLSSSAPQPLTPGHGEGSAQVPPAPLPTLLQSDEGHESIHGIQPWHSIPSGTSVAVSEALMSMDLTSYNKSDVASGIQSKTSSRNGPPSTFLPGIGKPSKYSHLSASPSRDAHLRSQQLIANPSSSLSPSPSPSPSKRTVPLPFAGVPQSSSDGTGTNADMDTRTTVPDGNFRVSPVRMRPPSARPRSFHDILEGFNLYEGRLSMPSSVSSAGLGSVQEGEDEGGVSQVDTDGDDRRRVRSALDLQDCVGSEGNRGLVFRGMQEDGAESDKPGRVREDTARRRKRISLPAVALQTAPVFSRARSWKKDLARAAGVMERTD